MARVLEDPIQARGELGEKCAFFCLERERENLACLGGARVHGVVQLMTKGNLLLALKAKLKRWRVCVCVCVHEELNHEAFHGSLGAFS